MNERAMDPPLRSSPRSALSVISAVVSDSVNFLATYGIFDWSTVKEISLH